MKKLLVLLSLLVSLTSCKSELLENDTTKFKDGDIIFHTSKSSQSKMLQMATNSDLTHVGVIFYKNGNNLDITTEEGTTYLITNKTDTKEKIFLIEYYDLPDEIEGRFAKEKDFSVSIKY
jgi:hypothetical protein